MPLNESNVAAGVFRTSAAAKKSQSTVGAQANARAFATGMPAGNIYSLSISKTLEDEAASIETRSGFQCLAPESAPPCASQERTLFWFG